MNIRSIAVFAAAVASCVAMAAVPKLKGSAETAGSMGLKVKVLSGAKMMQSLTPAGQRWKLRRGDKQWTETHYNVREIWSGHERGVQWKDRKGNILTLATPTSFCPSFEQDHAMREDIEKKMSEDAEAFKEPTDETLARWASDFTEKNIAASALSPFAAASLDDARIVDFGDISRIGAFFKTKDGEWHYADFMLAQDSKSKERESLMKAFLKGVAVDKSKSSSKGGAEGVVAEGRWLTFPEKDGYVFKTDLSRTQGAAFIKQAGRLMSAMRDAYKRYVPPIKKLGVSTVRVFSTREGYNEYMQGATGESGERSIGLWSPSHEELLILDQGNSERAETLKIMRHEAFHQYLFYATGNGHHAMWFNEGHACFFENVVYDAKKNFVKIWDDPTDRRPRAVSEDPEKYAKLVKTVIGYDHEKFYSGSLMKVNDNYIAAWAAVYFLEKGSRAFKEFAPYGKVLPAYMKAMADGKKEDVATKEAWELVSDRDFVADFLKFWNKRKAARNFEPKAE